MCSRLVSFNRFGANKLGSSSLFITSCSARLSPTSRRGEEVWFANQKQNKSDEHLTASTKEKYRFFIPSVGRVSIVLSCQEILAMFNVVRRQRPALACYGNIRDESDSKNGRSVMGVTSNFIRQKRFHNLFSTSTIFPKRAAAAAAFYALDLFPPKNKETFH